VSSRFQQGIIAALVVLNLGFIGWRLTDTTDAQLAALTGPTGGPGMGGQAIGGPGMGGPGMGGPGMGGPGMGGPGMGGQPGGEAGMGGPAGGAAGMGAPGAGGALNGATGAPPPPGLPEGGAAPPPGYSAEDLFPIAGMPDWKGAEADACPTLERFLTVADSKLAGASAGSPLTIEARTALLAGSCSLADPAVKQALEPYRGAFGQAGLRPLPPFLYFGGEAPAGAPPQ
jgi:hypothetical protein